MNGQSTLRWAQPADQWFLRALFVGTHPEFALLAPEVAAGLIDLQLRAQASAYRAHYPEAIDHIIELAGVPVGRCWTHQSDTELRLLDLAVLRSHRRQGIARRVLTDLQTSAAEGGMPMRLSVWRENAPAGRLYDELGFVQHGQHNGYLNMEFRAAVNQSNGG